MNFSCPPDRPDWPALIEAAGLLVHADVSFEYVVTRAKGRLVGLAVPFDCIAVDDGGEWDPGITVHITTNALRLMGLFAQEGITAISPVVMRAEMIASWVCADIADPLDRAFWHGWSQPILSACSSVVIPVTFGWADDPATWRAACQAVSKNNPVYLMKEFAL